MGAPKDHINRGVHLVYQAAVAMRVQLFCAVISDGEKGPVVDITGTGSNEGALLAALSIIQGVIADPDGMDVKRLRTIERDLSDLIEISHTDIVDLTGRNAGPLQ